ncbi:MAG: PUA domain-containing protein [Candidatus Bathyarchaeia archaeon]|nr:RNA-binding protein [Candidatus Bathyarchaeota archaeon]
MRRVTLRAKEARRILRGFSDRYPWVEAFIRVRGRVEAVELGVGRLLIVDGSPLILEFGGFMVPTLAFEEALNGLPVVVVDMGAVPHICRGADVMAPGVRSVRGVFERDGVVRVVDERHGKALCVGVALASSSEVLSLGRGRVVKNLHYVGDEAWRVLYSIK